MKKKNLITRDRSAFILSWFVYANTKTHSITVNATDIETKRSGIENNEEFKPISMKIGVCVVWYGVSMLYTTDVTTVFYETLCWVVFSSGILTRTTYTTDT